MTKRLWVRTPAPYSGWMLAKFQAITLKKIENKDSQMGLTKKNTLKKY
jgi:hypothetical protein